MVKKLARCKKVLQDFSSTVVLLAMTYEILLVKNSIYFVMSAQNLFVPNVHKYCGTVIRYFIFNNGTQTLHLNKFKPLLPSRSLKSSKIKTCLIKKTLNQSKAEFKTSMMLTWLNIK